VEYTRLKILLSRGCSVISGNGELLRGDAVIITTGTFLRGKIHIGNDSFPAGRMGDKPAIGLAKTLERVGFRMGRLKTGTPPRLKKSSIDLSVLKKMSGDEKPIPFSFMNSKVWINVSENI